MSQRPKSFEERLAEIEKSKAATRPPAAAQQPKAAAPGKNGKKKLPEQRPVPMAVNILAFVFVIFAGFGAAFAFGSTEFKLKVLDVLSPGFGQVATAETEQTDRYEWDTKPTPFNAARLGLKRMNAFEQDMSDMEMHELVRRAQGLGQPFLANEIEQKMGACETLLCRSELRNQYKAQLDQLRKSTPSW